MPLDPKQIVEDAKRARLIANNDDFSQSVNELSIALQEAILLTALKNTKIRFPSEAGIARLPSSTPKRNRPKTDPSRRKWITKGEAKAKGYSL
jgi:hypothetical protein